MAKIRKLVGRFHLLVILQIIAILLVFREEGLTANAQAPDVGGKIYLNDREAHVMDIAGNTTIINNDCGGLNNCSGTACSRVTCNPIVGGQKSLTCTSVDNNENFALCPSQACQGKVLLDYTRSFVTLPAPAYTNLQTEVARDICLQRPLEPTFKSMTFPSEYILVFFGSASGAFRAFPGREQNETICTSFDPRRRPWYVNGISVSKDVKILVDVGSSMSNRVPVEYNQQDGRSTYLNVTQNITRGVLQTFSPGDYVEVITFDSQTATSLSTPVLMQPSFDYLTPDRTELLPLIAKVNGLVASQDIAPSNLTGAILQAVSSFKPSKFSRIIIVLTDGQFAPLDATFPAQALLSAQTKVMIYKLPRDLFDTDPFLLSTSLQKTLCSVNGSFELLDPLATTNPRYAVRSYYTFLARTQLVAAGGKPTWSYKYASVSQNLNVITVTYPAFGSDGLLIGVAGVDVVVDNLNTTLKGLVLSDFKNRLQGVLPVPAIIPMSCNYQTSNSTGYCPNSPTPDDSAICQQIDNSITLAARTCCGDCGHGGGGGGLSVGAIVGIAIGAVAAAILALVVGILICRYCRPEEIGPVFQFTGPDNERINGTLG